MTDRELMQMALDALKDAALCVQHNSCPPDGGNDWDEQIEALRDRLAQPEQEPVCVSFIRQLVSVNENGIETWEEKPLYATPSKREWIGLTAKDLAEIPSSCYEGAIWADAKLKEKNHG